MKSFWANLKSLTLPFGVSEGVRVVLDGLAGAIKFYNESDSLIGFLNSVVWRIGEPGKASAELDPLSGLRLRDGNNGLRTQLSATEGLVLREPEPGVTGVILNHDGLLVIDPDTGERISITSGTTSAVPTPHYNGYGVTHPGGSPNVVAPSGTRFGPTDIDVRFLFTSAPSNLGASSIAPFAGYTEFADVADSGGGITLSGSGAYKAPADNPPLTHFHVSTLDGWRRRHGHTVIVNGDGSTAFRAAEPHPVFTTTLRNFDLVISYPAGTVEGDLVLVAVGIASVAVPVGWATPDIWKQLAVQVAAEGGHTLGSGVWYARAPADLSDVTVPISMSAAGLTKVQVMSVAIEAPYAYPAGLDIRRNNRSMPRGEATSATEVVDTANWADTNLPQAFCTTPSVPLVAGRKYRINFECPAAVFNALHANCQWRLAIQRDDGSGFADAYVVSRRKMSAAGTEELPLNGGFTYIPPADEVSAWRVRLTNVVASSGYNIMLRGSATAARTLTVTDNGAEY